MANERRTTQHSNSTAQRNHHNTMSRTVHQTTGTFSSAGGGDSYQQPQAPPQQASHNQQQRTTAQPSYSFGDVVFVLRRLGGTLQPLYHHAGIVTGVMDGTITQILHFDPLFDRHGDGDMPPWDLVKRSMVGVYSFPEFLDGHQLKTVFPEQDLHIEKCVCPSHLLLSSKSLQSQNISITCVLIPTHIIISLHTTFTESQYIPFNISYLHYNQHHIFPVSLHCYPILFIHPIMLLYPYHVHFSYLISNTTTNTILIKL